MVAAEEAALMAAKYRTLAWSARNSRMERLLLHQVVAVVARSARNSRMAAEMVLE